MSEFEYNPNPAAQTNKQPLKALVDQYGYIILSSGGSGGASPGSPLPISSPATLRGTQTPTITSGSAYASGNVVGGLLTFANMARVAGQGGVLQGGFLKDKSGNNTPYDLFLFDAAPVTPTDKTAVALVAADLAKSIGVMSFSGAALGASSTMGVMTVAGFGMPFKLTSGTTIYGVLVTRGTPTYSGTADVSVDLMVLPD